jgi:hypothetical protein
MYARSYPLCVAVAMEVFFGLALFADLAAGLRAGVSTQFIQCGEYRPAVKVFTCNPPILFSLSRSLAWPRPVSAYRSAQGIPPTVFIPPGLQPGTATCPAAI